MPDIECIRAEIERMRIQVHRQRGEIRQLQRAGIPTTSAEALLDRMLNNIDTLCAERDRLKAELPAEQRESAGRTEVVKHFQDDPNPPPFIKALAEVRHLATREGWCYQHVQAITVAIDQYAEKALGNREYFLNKPYSIGGGRKDHVP